MEFNWNLLEIIGISKVFHTFHGKTLETLRLSKVFQWNVWKTLGFPIISNFPMIFKVLDLGETPWALAHDLALFLIRKTEGICSGKPLANFYLFFIIFKKENWRNMLHEPPGPVPNGFPLLLRRKTEGICSWTFLVQFLMIFHYF